MTFSSCICPLAHCAIDKAVNSKSQIESINALFSALERQNDRCNVKDSEIDLAKKAQADNIGILRWIVGNVSQNPHSSVLERTRADDEYDSCCGWFFESDEFKRWDESQEPLEVLWVCGTGEILEIIVTSSSPDKLIVGTGKSTLSCRAVEWHLSRTSTQVGKSIAYAYCSNSLGGLSNNPTIILRYIVQHLSQVIGDRNLVAPVVRLQVLSEILRMGTETRIIIDALDECKGAHTLLKTLKDILPTSKGRIKMLLTSRPDVEVRTYFPQCMKINLNHAMTESDMDRYVYHEVLGREDDKRLLGGTRPNLETELIHTLLNQANGMFLWVRLQLELFLCEDTPFYYSGDVQSKIKELKDHSVDPEKALSATYKEIFERNTRPDTYDRQHAEKALRLFYVSVSPLTFEALSQAVAVNTEDESSPEFGHVDNEVNANLLRKICRNFLIENVEDEVEFAHVSVQEYLAESGIASEGVELEMLRVCMCFIKTLPYCGSQGTVGASEILEKSFFGTASSFFLSYAFDYWLNHCEQCVKSSTDSPSTHQFLVESLTGPSWVEPFHRWRHLWRQTRAPDHHLPPPLIFYFAEWRFHSAAEKLISDDPEIVTLEGQGCPLLEVAIGRSDTKFVAMLLRFGAQLDSVCSPFKPAIMQRNTDMVKLLLDRGVVPQEDNSIHEAAIRDQISILELLRDAGANLNERFNGKTILHAAASRADVATVDWCLQNGIEIECRDKSGSTALHYTTRYGAYGSSILLLDRGADIRSRNNLGVTVLHHAATRGDLGLFEHLLNHGADIHARDNRGRGVMHHFRPCLANQENNPLMTRHFLEKGLSVQDCDGNGLTPLMVMSGLHYEIIRDDFLENLQAMLQAGADACSKNDWGLTAMHLGAFNQGHIGALNLLKQHGADVNAKDCDGVSPLMLYVLRNFDEAGIRFFLDNGANPKDRASNGWSAMHFAALACPKILLHADHFCRRDSSSFPLGPHNVCGLSRKGFEIDEPDNQGNTPILLAVITAMREFRRGTLDFAMGLGRHGANVQKQTNDGEQLALRDDELIVVDANEDELTQEAIERKLDFLKKVESKYDLDFGPSELPLFFHLHESTPCQ
ncbi:MAG: hypothetical protein Q9227_007952 [Pyrenula ochraceoflavens]